MTRPASVLTLDQTLARVQQRWQARRWAGRLLWALAAATVSVGLMGLLRWAGPGAGMGWIRAGWAAGLGAGTALLTLLVLTRRAAPLTRRRAAQLSEAHLNLNGLLSTALALGGPPAGELEQAMTRRVQAQAAHSVQALDPASVPLPRLPRAAPLLLALGGLLCLGWLRSPPAGPGPVQATAVQVEVQAPLPDEVRAPKQAAPEAPAGPEQAADQARGTDRPAGASAQASGPGTGPGAGLRESQLGLGDTSGVRGSAASGAGGRTQNAGFGSRESAGQAAAPRPDSGPVLAAAPYDPGAAKGQAEVQKTGGRQGQRQASGGRGLESDSQDTCVDGCLTNNDMSRSQASREPPQPPGTPATTQTKSGTSDSGGAAAGSSSAVGLGRGRERALPGRSRTSALDGAAVAGQRVQVLGLNTGAATDSGAATVTAWQRRPEAAAAPSDLPAEAQAVAGRYFARGSAP